MDSMIKQLIFAVGGQELLLSGRLGYAKKVCLCQDLSRMLRGGGSSSSRKRKHRVSVCAKCATIVDYDVRMIKKIRGVVYPIYFMDKKIHENIVKYLSDFK